SPEQVRGEDLIVQVGMPVVVVPAVDRPAVPGIPAGILGPAFVEPPDPIPLHRMPVAGGIGLVPDVHPDVREWLPPAADLVVEDLGVVPPGDGDPVLSGIDQVVVPYHDVTAAAVPGHDAAARLARPASPDLVADDLDGIVRRAAGLVDVDDVLGMAL